MKAAPWTILAERGDAPPEARAAALRWARRQGHVPAGAWGIVAVDRVGHAHWLGGRPDGLESAARRRWGWWRRGSPGDLLLLVRMGPPRPALAASKALPRLAARPARTLPRRAARAARTSTPARPATARKRKMTQTYLPGCAPAFPRCACGATITPRAAGRPRRRCEACAPSRCPRIGDRGWTRRACALDHLGVPAEQLEALGLPPVGEELVVLRFRRSDRGVQVLVRAEGRPPVWMPRAALARLPAPCAPQAAA